MSVVVFRIAEAAERSKLAPSASRWGKLVLGFYGFWLVWRVSVRWLPGPVPREGRIVPFALWFRAPFVDRPARWLRVPEWAAAAGALMAVAAGPVVLGRLG